MRPLRLASTVFAFVVAAIFSAARPSIASAAPDAAASVAPPVEQGAARGVDSLVDHIISSWFLFATAAAIIVLATIVNRYAPQKRKRIRRVVILFLLYFVAFGIAEGLARVGVHDWADRLQFVAWLLGGYTVVNIAALLLFELALPALRIQHVSLTSDVLIGIAYFVTTLLVLKAAGVNTGSVITTGAVVSGFVVISTQDSLKNIFGGLALQLDDSIHVNDWVQLENGKQGKVKEIRWRHTVVETRDWDTIIVPNSALLSSNITILGKREGMPYQHRMWVYFNVDFRYSPARVIAVVNEALQAAPIERVAAEPKPHAIVMDFAKDARDSFAYYAVRYWLTDLAVDDPTSSQIRQRIHAALRRAGIPLARPVQTVFLDHDDAEARAARWQESRVASLRAHELFRSLTDDERAFVAKQLRFAPFTPGETMTKQGAEAHWLYIMTTGSAEVRTHVEGETKTVATLHAPTFFGEMGLLTGEARTADVVAMTEVECYRLDKATFQKILEERPELAHEVSRILAERRIELIATREGLDQAAKNARAAAERQRIFNKIQDFFGLGRNTIRPPT